MLEHQKLVIQNVVHNKELFKKEIYKTLGWLNSSEQTEFRRWLRNEFWNTHRDVIKEVLSLIAA